jgi:hypothetical protein
MAVEYPTFPPPRDMKPGEGINANPFDQNEYLDYSAPMGSCTGVYYGIVFQLGKWGFERFKINEGIFVSPINKGYYDLVLGEKERLSQQIKTGLASISQAYADLELILHDLRKYREYVKLFNDIREAEEIIKREKDEKKIEEAKMKKLRAIQTLRSIFIDQVDVHTDLPNTPIALRSITSRWPTIISDFMKLERETTPEEIKLDVSYAEKVVLATKNKLFLSWMEMFEKSVTERYKRLKELAVARENSLKEYKEMLKPTIARYKMINDFLSSSDGRSEIYKSFFRPDAQAFSIDSMTIWAWKPFSPEEKWKATREYFDKISLKDAGFTEEEIDELIKRGAIKSANEKIEALPIEPSIDRIVRLIKERINKEYGKFGVTLNTADVLKARKRLLEQFKNHSSSATSPVVWPFSPYFVFVEIPMNRTVLVLPNGIQIEDLSISNLRTFVKTQNIIIGHLMELIAKEKILEIYIDSLLGEFGFDKDEKIKNVKDMLKEEFVFIYGEEKDIEKYFAPPIKKEEKKKLEAPNIIKKFFDYFGINPSFFRAFGPYEYNVSYRLAKYYLKVAGGIFSQIKNYFHASFQVPGTQVEVRV